MLYFKLGLKSFYSRLTTLESQDSKVQNVPKRLKSCLVAVWKLKYPIKLIQNPKTNILAKTLISEKQWNTRIVNIMTMIRDQHILFKIAKYQNFKLRSAYNITILLTLSILWSLSKALNLVQASCWKIANVEIIYSHYCNE